MTIDLLAIGTSSLRAYRASLEVVGGNVANAGTDGYVRRRADLAAGPVFGGDNLRYLGIAGGSGVRIGGVSRSYDVFLAQQSRETRSVAARDQSASIWLAEIERALGTQENGVAAALGRFFNAGDELSASPTSIAARTQFAGETANVADMFRQTGAALAGLKSDIVASAADAAAQASSALDALALVNERLRRAGPGTAAAASLLDERDRQLQAVAAFVPIHVNRLANGEVEVRLEDMNGDVLLSGTRVAALAVTQVGDVPRLFVDADFAPRDITLPASGSIAGLFDAYARAAAALDDLDSLASRFADTMNAAHMDGVDLVGERGAALFGTVAVSVAAGPGNTGQAVVKAVVTGTLSTSGYSLVYDAVAGAWTLARNDGTASVSGAGPLSLDGLAVEPGGTPAAGDRFMLNPLSGAAALRANISDPTRIAAAAAFQINTAAPGLAGSRIVLDAGASLAAADLYRFTWVDPATVEVTDSAGNLIATVPYTPGDVLEGAGFRLIVAAAPAAGDSIDIYPTPPNHSDNQNISALVTIGSVAGEAFENRFAAQRNAASTALSQTRRRAEISAIAANDAAAVQSNATGVNLDEEAADLIRFQQAYEASTRIISAARDMFDTLLGIS